MGLFDIFRRKHKDESAETAPEQKETTKQQVGQDQSATNQAQKSPEKELSAEENHPSQTAQDTTTENGEQSSSNEDQSTADVVKSHESSNDERRDEEAAEANVSENQNAEEQTDADKQEQQPAERAKMQNEEPKAQPESDNLSEEDKYTNGLAKSRHGFGARLNKFLANFRHVDEDFFEDLEDMLIESDVGYDMAMKLSDSLRKEVKLQNAKSKQDVSNVIIQKMVELYDEAGDDEQTGLNFAKEGPTVIMFVGVNGAGKTTTIGKMASLFKKQGKKVLLAAADTFRAGATEQLDVWAKRDGVDIVTGPENGDPAAVVFDGVKKAKQENYDILFVDTAGRLQNKKNLMKELAKMKRVLAREIPDAPHEVLLVLDATTGQNALNQAKLFKESTDVTGIVLTKLDGTARGGIVLAIRNELHLPVKYVGLGEKVDDLQKFDASEFVYGLFKGLVTTD